MEPATACHGLGVHSSTRDPLPMYTLLSVGKNPTPRAPYDLSNSAFLCANSAQNRPQPPHTSYTTAEFPIFLHPIPTKISSKQLKHGLEIRIDQTPHLQLSPPVPFARLTNLFSVITVVHFQGPPSLHPQHPMSNSIKSSASFTHGTYGGDKRERESSNR